jgi:hypothetical protein
MMETTGIEPATYGLQSPRIATISSTLKPLKLMSCVTGFSSPYLHLDRENSRGFRDLCAGSLPWQSWTGPGYSAWRSRSQAEGEGRSGANKARHHLANRAARGSKAIPKMHRFYPTELAPVLSDRSGQKAHRVTTPSACSRTIVTDERGRWKPWFQIEKPCSSTRLLR